MFLFLCYVNEEFLLNIVGGFVHIKEEDMECTMDQDSDLFKAIFAAVWQCNTWLAANENAFTLGVVEVQPILVLLILLVLLVLVVQVLLGK